jgi:Arc/MetJ family transcription regulator
MTKRLVDIDDAKLAAVQAELGTSTMKETVDVALSEVLALVARRKALLSDRGADLSLLGDPDARRAAWRSST